MSLKILKYKELQRIKSTPVLEVTPELRKFAAELFATMSMSGGIGLASAQVGRYINFLVFDVVRYTNDAFDSGYFFNPEIIAQSEETEVNVEGCLSFPGEYYHVRRPTWITIKYLSLSNEEVIRTYKGLAARVLCHELDHILGLTMFDREGQ